VADGTLAHILLGCLGDRLICKLLVPHQVQNLGSRFTLIKEEGLPLHLLQLLVSEEVGEFRVGQLDQLARGQRAHPVQTGHGWELFGF
jgi:hypothetical protein